MATYIYYESTTPPGVAQWELFDKNIESILSILEATDNIISDELIEVAGIGDSVTRKLIIYFENKQTADTHLSNTPNIVSFCSDPEMVKYCNDNNIVYSVSVNDTSNTLTEIIDSLDSDNFSSWSIR